LFKEKTLKTNYENGRTGELNTIIGKGSVLEGNIRVQNSMRVDGRIKGDVECSDTVVIGKEGEVQGEVKANNVLLAGRLVGKIIAQGKVYLESKSVILGDLKASRLVVDDGAVFDGSCVMNNKEQGSKREGQKESK
jgi:cytoskeletal protein CcmA (bactofilin family)